MSKFSGLWNRITGTFPRVSTMFQSMEVTGAIHVDVKQFSEIPVGGAAYLTGLYGCVGILGSARCGRQYLFHKFVENSQEDLQAVLANTAIEEATLCINPDVTRASTNYGSESHADSQQNIKDITEAFKERNIIIKSVQPIAGRVLVVNSGGELSLHHKFTPLGSREADGVISAVLAPSVERPSTGCVVALDYSYYGNNHVENLNREKSQTDISTYRK